MGRLGSAQHEAIPDAAFDFSETIEAVKFLMNQLKGLEAPIMAKVKVPAGGGIAWEIPNGTEDPSITKTLEGLIVNYHAMNAYWDKPRTEGANESPACASMDGISGYDIEGLEYPCRTCLRNRMGSAEFGNSKGKACKNMARLLLLREGDALPLEIIIPTMSLPNLSAYMDRLAHERLTIRDVLTRITLAKATNKKGDPYSKAQFQVIGKVDTALVSELRQSMARLLTSAETLELHDENDGDTTLEAASTPNALPAGTAIPLADAPPETAV